MNHVPRMKHVLRMVSNVPPRFEMWCGGALVDFTFEVSPRMPRGKIVLAFMCNRCRFIIGRAFNMKSGDISDPPDP